MTEPPIWKVAMASRIDGAISRITNLHGPGPDLARAEAVQMLREVSAVLRGSKLPVRSKRRR